MYEFQLNGNEECVLLLTGLPGEPDIDEIPTPKSRSGKISFISESCLATIGARLGQMFGYAQMDAGALFYDIVPQPGMEREQLMRVP